MVYEFFFGIVLVMLWEISFLKKIDLKLYIKSFQMPTSILMTICIMFLMILAASRDRPDVFPGFFLVFILPLYVFRRRKLIKDLELSNIAPNNPQHSDRLVLEAISVIYYWMIGLIIISLLVVLWVTLYPQFDKAFWEMIIVSSLSSLLLFTLVCFAARSFSQEGISANLRLKMHNTSWITVFLLPAIIGLIFGFFSAKVVLDRPFQPDTPLNQVMNSTPTTPMLFGAFILVALIFAPLLEEVIFRGYFFHVFTVFKSRLFAVVFIALMFGGLHFYQYWGDWAAVGLVTLLGFALTSVRSITNSTWSSITMHYSYNIGTTLIAIFLMFQANPSFYQYISNPNLEFTRKEALLKESIDLKPRYTIAYNELAWLYAEQKKKLEEALILIEKAIELEPNKPVYIDTKIKVLYEMNRLPDARALRDYLAQEFPEWVKNADYDYLEEKF